MSFVSQRFFVESKDNKHSAKVLRKLVLKINLLDERKSKT